jgi:hypothetical protein
MTEAMAPLFIIVMLMGEASDASISGGNICESEALSSGESMVEGSMSIFAMPRLALKTNPVPLMLGKYFV